jgi:hypothetical protein
MNFLLFVLEIVLILEIVLVVVGIGIALMPVRSELRVSRTRVIHNEREQGKSVRS